jgi:hypothetical protein
MAWHDHSYLTPISAGMATVGWSRQRRRPWTGRGDKQRLDSHQLRDDVHRHAGVERQ